MSRRDLHRLSEPAAAPAPRKGAHVRQARAAAQGSQGARMGGDSSSSLGMPSNPRGEGAVRPRGLSVQLTPTRDHLHQVFIARNVVLLAALGGIAFAIAEAGSALRSPWAAGVSQSVHLVPAEAIRSGLLPRVLDADCRRCPAAHRGAVPFGRRSESFYRPA